MGVLLGHFLPGFAFSFAPIASTLLFALLFVTLIDIDLWPKKVAADALVEGISTLVFGYLLIPLLILVIVKLAAIESRLAAALLLTSLAPFALVAPLFAANCGGKPGPALWQVLISMILCPIIIPLFLWLSGLEIQLFVRPLVLYLGVISLGPYILGLLVQRFFKPLLTPLIRFKSSLASLLLALLVYVLFGSAVHKWEGWNSGTLVWGLILFHVLSDFGLFYLTHLLLKKPLGAPLSITYAVTMGMKNMAIPAGILLAYDPSMAFVPAIGFAVHAVFFNFLGMRGKALL